jgi:hypothetical protein
MFKIYNGRDMFFQWDINQKVIVSNDLIKEVHFTNASHKEALVCEVYEEDGIRVADVPNILLQDCWDIKVYGYCGECTRVSSVFKVIDRNKPADYVYTETEVKSYAALEERITKLESGGIALTKVSELENDAEYQTAAEVETAINTALGVIENGTY